MSNTAKLCSIFGVQLNQPFKIYKRKFRITEKEIQVWKEYEKNWKPVNTSSSLICRAIEDSSLISPIWCPTGEERKILQTLVDVGYEFISVDIQGVARIFKQLGHDGKLMTIVCPDVPEIGHSYRITDFL